MTHDPCEYLARVGFAALVGEPAEPLGDPDDPAVIAETERADHRRIADTMRRADPAKPIPNYTGAKWLGRLLAWPDRVPGLKTWAGNQTLDKLINLRVAALGSEPIDDLYGYRVGMRGPSGLYGPACPDAIDMGFSLAEFPKMLIEMRPAMELLAIVGLETLPLVSWDTRVCGFLHDGYAWRFRVEPRDGGYYHRWGQMRRLEIDAASPVS